MKKIVKILGTGCPKCKTLAILVNEVISENNIDASVEKVEDIMEIMKYDVMSTPALVVDESIKVKGKVPSKAELIDILISDKNESNNSNEESCCSQDNCC